MKKSVTILALLLCLAAAGWLGFRLLPAGRSAGAATEAAPSSPRIPVMAELAEYTDVPVYLSGLGTVQAFNSVLIRSRVDGQILKMDFAEGQEVRAGDTIAEIDPRSYAAALAQAKATKVKDQAMLDNAQLDLKRYRGLVAQDSIPRQQLDTQGALAQQLQGTVDADQAQIDMAQVQLSYCSIRSPIDGRVGARLVDAGNIVHANDTTGIVSINQVRPIWVSFALPAASLAEVRARQRQGDVEVIAEGADGHELATGKLSVIDNQINATTATITYKATFQNADEGLWPGQFVNIRLLLQVRRHALTVPVTAVVRGPEGAYAFVVGADGVAEKRPIKLGFSNRTIAIIDSGLAAGDRVVTDGQYRIEAGSHVEVLAPPAASLATPQNAAAPEATQ
ncbi:MAG TPA: efflux RND transporter periplasmic adaptor subunit [Vicinamibacteria bacterium]|jgi:multidrug efflux system membrane fusion protein|nr:efflux RND transporter periplasmic adaptor subunit [Vicinamibacteria bacterium]